MPPSTKNAHERFWPKVQFTDTCWIWAAYCNRLGYGRFSIGRAASMGAHRWAYQQLRGPVPSGLVLDHLCRNRACINPWHLEAVTYQVNTQRGVNIGCPFKTHCKRGHEFTPENTIGKKHRICRQCNNMRARAAYAATRPSVRPYRKAGAR